MASGWSWMRKTPRTQFIPSKAEEEQAAARGIPYRPRSDLVEFRVSSSQAPPPNNWRFHKIIHAPDGFKGIKLSHHEMVDCIFQGWPKSFCDVVYGYNKLHVKVHYFDVDGSLVGCFQDEDIYVIRSKRKDNEYSLMCSPVAWSQKPLFSRDEIELFPIDNDFGLKLIRRYYQT